MIKLNVIGRGIIGAHGEGTLWNSDDEDCTMYICPLSIASISPHTRDLTLVRLHGDGIEYMVRGGMAAIAQEVEKQLKLRQGGE